MKILIIGDSSVGKTTMMQRMTNGNFLNKSVPSENEIYLLRNDGNQIIAEVHTVLTDSVTLSKFRKYDAFIWMFDLTNQRSLKSIEGSFLKTDKPCVVVGNKNDLERFVTPDEISTFVRNNKVKYYETSYKSNYQFEKPFLTCGLSFEVVS